MRGRLGLVGCLRCRRCVRNAGAWFCGPGKHVLPPLLGLVSYKPSSDKHVAYACLYVCRHVISASPDLVLPTPSDPPAASPSGSPTSSMDAPPLQQPLSESGEVLTTLAEVEGVPAKAPGSSGRAVHSPMYRRIARLAVRGA